MGIRTKYTEHSRDRFINELKRVGFKNARKLDRGSVRKSVIDREKLIVK